MFRVIEAFADRADNLHIYQPGDIYPRAGFVPDVLNTGIYDEIFKAAGDDAFSAAKLLAKKEGISVGISSGAALHGAIELAKRPENKGKVIVAVLPDSGDRYYSTALFTE